MKFKKIIILIDTNLLNCNMKLTFIKKLVDRKKFICCVCCWYTLLRRDCNNPKRVPRLNAREIKCCH